MDANCPDSNELVRSVLETLAQGEALLAQLADADYTRSLPAAFHASIGGHYRHCLDHFRALLDAAVEGDLNYDHRERGTLVENDRFAALNAYRELRQGFERLDLACLSRPLTVTCKTSLTLAGSESAPSTVAREIMYCVAHAVHHYALIGFMANVMGLNLPPKFGFAPSTIKHREQAPTSA
jgi:uncharacterized damage-inducible protein DinB